MNWLKFNPIQSYSCPVKKSKRKKLTIQQLLLLEEKKFQDLRLQYARDLFVFSCYTGFAFADVMLLHKEHFEWDTDGTIWCKLYRQKSDVLSAVPLIETAAKIIGKYHNFSTHSSSLRIFPFATNQEINRRLKIIQESCEIDMPVSFHVARHTFAKTVALKNGVPLETIQMMLGHIKITTTQIYADVDEEKIVNDVRKLEEKLNSARVKILNNQFASL